MATKMNGAVALGAGGWWVAEIGVDSVDAAVLRSACSDRLCDWDGVIGRYDTEAEAEAALAREIAWFESEAAGEE